MALRLGIGLVSGLACLGCAGTPSNHAALGGHASRDERRAGLAELAASLAEIPILSTTPGDPDGWGMALLGEVRQEPGDGPVYRSVGVNLDHAAYFYPASTVKLYGALGAGEKLEELASQHPGLSLASPWVIHPLFEGESIERSDGSNLDGARITLGHEVRKLFLVSDNRAYNRLYAFVGHAELDRRARAWGLTDTRLVHRLSEARTLEENRRTHAIDLMGRDASAPAHVSLPERTDPPTVASNAGMEHLLVGERHVAGGGVVEGPFDFTDKNATTLADLQRALAMLCDPDAFERRLAIGEHTRAFLVEAATGLPRDSQNPLYDPAEYPDDYAKYLLPGLSRVAPARDWRITNKIGLAYGFVTENARIEHVPSGRSVYLAMTVYRNPNATVNDGDYDYDRTLSLFADAGERVGRWLVPE
ncbi:MAG: serine hydrolase [Phycisphaerales bacterium JB040]